MLFSQTLSSPACPDNSLPASSLQLPASRTVAHVCVRKEFPTFHLPPPTSRTRNSFRMHSYEKCVRKPFGIRSYKIIALKLPWNQILPKKGWGEGAANSPNGRSVRHCWTPAGSEPGGSRFRRKLHARDPNRELRESRWSLGR